MMRLNIHPFSDGVTRVANRVDANTPVATLTIPSGLVYRLKDGTPLVLKLFGAGGVELPREALVFLSWQYPVGESLIQSGMTMDYGTFRRISIADQANIHTREGRLIRFDDEEIARAERGDLSIITGLPSGYRIQLMVRSSMAVDWTQAANEFSFEAEILTREEFLAEQARGVAV